MTPQSRTRSSSAGYQSSSAPSQKYPRYSVASPSQAPASVRIRPHNQPVPSACATGFGGTTREAPGRASADDSSRSSSSPGAGVHTGDTVEGCAHRRTHRHGERETYGANCCRCDRCRAANAAYARKQRRQAAYGRTPGGWTDAGPVRAHVQRLRAAGLGRRQIAIRSGIDENVIQVLMNGRGGRPPTARVAPRTAQRLLAVPLPTVDKLAPGAAVEGIGTRRRLQALVAIGWPQVALAEQLGWSRENLGRVVHGYGAGKVTVATRQAVVELYDRLWNAPPAPSTTSSRARRLAQQRGWPAPLAWDDDTIDDPRVRPNLGVALRREGLVVDEVAIQRAMRGDPVHLRPVERAEVVHRLTEAGYSAAQIAERVGIDKRSVQRIRDERRTAQEVRRDTPVTSPRPVLLGILGTSPEPWYEHDRGRAGDPAREVS